MTGPFDMAAFEAARADFDAQFPPGQAPIDKLRRAYAAATEEPEIERGEGRVMTQPPLDAFRFYADHPGPYATLTEAARAFYGEPVRDWQRMTAMAALARLGVVPPEVL